MQFGSCTRMFRTSLSPQKLPTYCIVLISKTNPGDLLRISFWRSLMRAATNAYRAKAFECLSLAECMNDPERRAELLQYARLWMQLTEPVGTFRSAYEVEPAIAPLSSVAQHNTWQQILHHKG